MLGKESFVEEDQEVSRLTSKVVVVILVKLVKQQVLSLDVAMIVLCHILLPQWEEDTLEQTPA